MNAPIIFIAKYFIYISAIIAVIYIFKQSREKRKDIFVFAVVLLPVSYILAKFAGLFYFDPRPFVLGHFAPLLPHATDNGFPSDHTLFGAAIAFAIFHFNKRLGTCLLLFAILMGFSRVLAGVHHTVDIAGSILIAGLVYLPLTYANPASWRIFQKKV